MRPARPADPQSDPYWNGFLQIMLRNGLYRGPELGIEMTGAYISRIEYVKNGSWTSETP
jgi:hypothetical protein